MPRNIFLSCLGTNDYSQITYEPLPFLSAEGEQIESYIQVARLKNLKRRGVTFDQGWVLCTQRAYECNWTDGFVRFDRDVQREKCKLKSGEFKTRDELSSDDELSEGLASALRRISCEQVKSLMIDDPTSEGALLDVLNRIDEQLERGDHVYVDITHGFRVIPLLLLNILEYLESGDKEIKIIEMSYGAFEAKQRRAGHDIAPTWDLLPLRDLSVWAQALRAFNRHGDVSELITQFREFRESRAGLLSADEALIETLHRSIDRLERFSDDLSLMRLNELGRSASALIEALEVLQRALNARAYQTERDAHDVNERDELSLYMGPLQRTLPSLINAFGQLRDAGPNHLESVLTLSEWLVERGRVHASITLAREWLNLAFRDWLSHRGVQEIKSKVAEVIVRAMMHHRGADRPLEVSLEHLSDPDNTPQQRALAKRAEALVNEDGFLTEYHSALQRLGQLRNNLNHAWLADQASSGTASEVRDEVINIVDDLSALYRHWGLRELRDQSSSSRVSSQVDQRAESRVRERASSAQVDSRSEPRLFILTLSEHQELSSRELEALRDQLELDVSPEGVERAPESVHAMWIELSTSGDALPRALKSEINLWVNKHQARLEGSTLLLEGEVGAVIELLMMLSSRFHRCVYRATPRDHSDSPHARFKVYPKV